MDEGGQPKQTPRKAGNGCKEPQRGDLPKLDDALANLKRDRLANDNKLQNEPTALVTSDAHETSVLCDKPCKVIEIANEQFASAHLDDAFRLKSL